MPIPAKDEAKPLGAHWDHGLKKWYISPGVFEIISYSGKGSISEAAFLRYILQAH